MRFSLPKILFLLALGLCLGFCPSCSSVSYNPDLGMLVNGVEEERLRQHVEGLVALGPRPAGNAEAQEATVAYLEKELAALGVATEREVFARSMNASVVMSAVDADGNAIEVPIEGTYFGSNISQARVVHGFADKAGIRESMTGYSMVPGVEQMVDQINLLATIPGTQFPNRVVEISAHHDTVPGTVGANDNTSGVAVMLEVARLLQEEPPLCTVRLCFFAAEEIGLRGAQEHVKRLIASGEIDQVMGLINLDTVGFYTDEDDSQHSPARIPFLVWPPSEGNFLAIIGGHGSAKLAHLLEDAAEVYAEDLPTYSLARLGGFLPDARRSDHARYWDVKVPAIFLTDTAEFRSDHYHRPSDSIEHLDFKKLRLVTMAVAAAAWEAAQGREF
ncbi:MAG: M20/M25/M40 family metallo-hydrolase [Planctomycetota bacterium]